MKKIKVLLVVLLITIILPLLAGCGNIDSFGEKATEFVQDGLTLINENLSNPQDAPVPDENQSKIDQFLQSAIGTTVIEMAIQLCATLVIFLIVRFLVWNKVTEILESRKKVVRDAMKERDLALDEAKKIDEESRIQKARANEEAKKIIEAAKKRGYNEAEQIISNANETAKLKISNANEEIERMKNESVEDVKREIVEVAYAMASKIVEKEVEKDKYDLPLEQFMKEDK